MPRSPAVLRGKTINSRYSLVVTHPTTNLPAHGLSTAERTGNPVFHVLWSIARDTYRISAYIEQCRDCSIPIWSKGVIDSRRVAKYHIAHSSAIYILKVLSMLCRFSQSYVVEGAGMATEYPVLNVPC